MCYDNNVGTSQQGVNEMENDINYQFSKHYGRMIEDLKQIKGFTPVMEKVISVNISKLHEDINEITKGSENDKKIYAGSFSSNS